MALTRRRMVTTLWPFLRQAADAYTDQHRGTGHSQHSEGAEEAVYRPGCRYRVNDWLRVRFHPLRKRPQQPLSR